MKILYIGNANFKDAGSTHFGYNTRIYNGLVRNGHYLYYFSDRDEVRTSSPFGMKNIGQRLANQKLVRVARYLRPDAIIMAHVNLIDEDTLRKIKRMLPDLRIARMNVDALFYPQNRINLTKYSDVIDATFITSGGPELSTFSTPTQKFYFVPNITDTSIDTGRAFAQTDPTYDLSCFMHNDRGADEALRLKIALDVQKALPDLSLCYRGFNRNRNIRGNEYLVALQNSAMALSLSRMTIDGMPSTPATRYLYSSDRVAHVMGNGALAFISDKFGLQDIYAQDEVAFFGNTEELIDKVRYYKQHPTERQMIAEKGWQKAHHEFNETIIMQYVLERLFDKPLSRDYAWPTHAY